VTTIPPLQEGSVSIDAMVDASFHKSDFILQAGPTGTRRYDRGANGISQCCSERDPRCKALGAASANACKVALHVYIRSENG
jgi:hypothetical protein